MAKKIVDRGGGRLVFSAVISGPTWSLQQVNDSHSDHPTSNHIIAQSTLAYRKHTEHIIMIVGIPNVQALSIDARFPHSCLGAPFSSSRLPPQTPCLMCVLLFVQLYN